jgi:hypothetical protein
VPTSAEEESRKSKEEQKNAVTSERYSWRESEELARDEQKEAR